MQPFGWNFVHNNSGHTHTHTHTQTHKTNCNENITPPRFRGGLIKLSMSMFMAISMSISMSINSKAYKFRSWIEKKKFLNFISFHCVNFILQSTSKKDCGCWNIQGDLFKHNDETKSTH